MGVISTALLIAIYDYILAYVHNGNVTGARIEEFYNDQSAETYNAMKSALNAAIADVDTVAALGISAGKSLSTLSGFELALDEPHSGSRVYLSTAPDQNIYPDFTNNSLVASHPGFLTALLSNVGSAFHKTYNLETKKAVLQYTKRLGYSANEVKFVFSVKVDEKTDDL